MTPRTLLVLPLLLVTTALSFAQEPRPIPGFRNPAAQHTLEQQFLAVPDAAQAGEHLRILTAEPHIAGSPEDKKTAEYVAKVFREAGLETEIVEYKVWLNYPVEISLEIAAPGGVRHIAPTEERVEGDPFQSDPRVVMAYNGFSPSGEADAEVIYANYGRPDDYRKLKEMGVEVRGKIVLVRYGENFRGVKAYTAQENGAAGVIIYSDPADDGYFKGDMYPKGPWRPDSGVQRGSIAYIFKYPGDPTTPGIASVPSLDDAQRTPPEKAASLPRIPTTPLSYADARPILDNLGGPESPRPWQGALPFTYHIGPGPVRVRMKLKQDYAYRTIWDVIGKIRGREFPDEWVTSGNHRDAWVYGAVDPNSGTAAQLEAARGLGALLKSGWRPRRTIVLGSWDAEEQGLIGSTEWAEHYSKELAGAVTYINMDAAAFGPKFAASAVPSLKQFVRDVAKSVSSPAGGSVYDAWKQAKEKEAAEKTSPDLGGSERPPVAPSADLPVGDLGSGSDYTAFLQHLGVPSTDVSSSGPYGVYHSVFDNFAWFSKFGDPGFHYLQQMARIYGLELLRLSEADALPFDYEAYGKEIAVYVQKAQQKSARILGKNAPDFSPALSAARRLTAAGAKVSKAQRDAGAKDLPRLNRTLREAERAFLLPNGLPNRPWFRHAIFAPGEYTGYAAVVLPGVNEALDANDAGRTGTQLAALVEAINRAAAVLEQYSK
jgi:N-acetylated-alpha-linked acidic dipeptidase